MLQYFLDIQTDYLEDIRYQKATRDKATSGKDK